MITTTIDISSIAGLGQKFVTLQQADSLLRSVAVAMQTETRERIHEKGQKADGTDIGQYSKSYKKLREAQGRESDKVYLYFNRDLQREYRVIALSDTEYGLGWENPVEAQKAEWLENGAKSATVGAHTRTVNGKKVEVKSHTRNGWSGYGKVWALTEQELEQVRAIVQEFIKRNFE